MPIERMRPFQIGQLLARDKMDETNDLKPNTFFVEVTGSGLPEVDGLFVPSTAPPAESESGTVSSLGYWNVSNFVIMNPA